MNTSLTQAFALTTGSLALVTGIFIFIKKNNSTHALTELLLLSITAQKFLLRSSGPNLQTLSRSVYKLATFEQTSPSEISFEWIVYSEIKYRTLPSKN